MIKQVLFLTSLLSIAVSTITFAEKTTRPKSTKELRSISAIMDKCFSGLEQNEQAMADCATIFKLMDIAILSEKIDKCRTKYNDDPLLRQLMSMLGSETQGTIN